MVPRLVSSVVCEPDNRAKVTGAAFLLYPVGEPVVVEQDRTEKKNPLGALPLFREICESLRKMHSFGIIHGDARLPNVVRATMPVVKTSARGGHTIEHCEERLMWIDFRQSELFSVDAAVSCENRLDFMRNFAWKDWRALFASCFPGLPDQEYLRLAQDAASASPSLLKFEGFVTSVWLLHTAQQ